MLHKVIINETEDEKELALYYGLETKMFEVGQKVEFSIITMTDTSYYVTSNQVTIQIQHSRSGSKTYYYFIMPDCDVYIQIDSRSTMVNPMFQAFNPMKEGLIGSTQKNLFDYQTQQLQSNVNQKDEFSWEGKPKFCQECGAPTNNSNHFCSVCGAKLEPTK